MLQRKMVIISVTKLHHTHHQWKVVKNSVIATEIIRTVHKHSNTTTLHGGGGEERYFEFNFRNRPDIFG